MSDDGMIPQEWQPYVPLVTSLVRHLLTAAGGAGFSWALAVNASQTQMAVSAALMLAAGLWSLVQKFRAQRALALAAASPPGWRAPPLPS